MRLIASICLALLLIPAAHAGGPRWHPPMLQVTTHPQRSTHELTMFKQLTGYPHGKPGCQIDHIIPLKRGGLDVWWNMQWLPIEAKYLKDRWE